MLFLEALLASSFVFLQLICIKDYCLGFPPCGRSPYARSFTEDWTLKRKKNINWVEEFLFTLQQVGRPLGQYVDEFLSMLHLMSWRDSLINASFRMGLKED